MPKDVDLWDHPGSVAAPLTLGADDPDNPSTTTGPRYEARGTVGTGGMGRVEVVRDRWLNRDVARKVLLGDGHDARLEREARYTARLDHPNVVRVLDTGIDEAGRRFYTMPLVRGHALADAFDAPLPRQIRTLVAVAQALAHAHDLGVVHRDVKPGNIMRGPLGEVLLVDWGLAADVGEPRPPEGTPGYCHPAQREGGPADPAHDRYALGRCLAAVLDRTEAPPPELLAVAHHAQDGGYASAAAFADDLEAWLDGRRVAAHSYSSRELLLRTIRAFRAPLAVAAVALVAATVQAKLAFDATTRERDRAIAAEADAGAHLAQLLTARAVDAFMRGDHAEAERDAVAALVRADTPLARGVLAATHAGRPRLVRDAPLPCDGAALLPDGRVSCPDDGGLAVVDTRGERVPLRFDDVQSVLPTAHGWLERAWRDLDGIASDSMRFVGAHGPGPWIVVPSNTPRAATPEGLLVHHDTEGGLWRPDGTRAFAWAPCPEGSHARLAPQVTAAGTVFWSCTDHVAFGTPPDRPTRVSVPTTPSALGAWRGRPIVADYDAHLALHLDEDDVRRVAVPGGTPRDVGVLEDWAIVSPERGGIRWARLPALTWQATLPRQDGPSFAVVDETLITLGTRLATWTAPPAAPAHRHDLPGGVTSLAFDASGVLLVGLHGHVVALHPDGERTTHALPDCTPVKDVAPSPEGILVACASERHGARRIAADGTITPFDVGGAPRVASREDGRALWATYGMTVLVQAPHQTPRPMPVGGVIFDLEPARGTPPYWALTPERRVVALDEHGQRTRTLGDLRAFTLAVSPDADALLLARGEHAQVVGTDGAVRWALAPGDRTADVAWSPAGDLVALGLLGGRTQVRQATDGTLLATLPGHAERVAAVSFSADGTTLATGSWDGTVRLWDVEAMRTPPDADDLAERYGARFANQPPSVQDL